MKEDLTVSGVELETKIMYNSNRMIKLLIAVTQKKDGCMCGCGCCTFSILISHYDVNTEAGSIKNTCPYNYVHGGVTVQCIHDTDP